MDVTAVAENPLAIAADTLVVNLFEGASSPSGTSGSLDRALGGALRELIATGDATGRAGEVSVLYPRGAASETGCMLSPAFRCCRCYTWAHLQVICPTDSQASGARKAQCPSQTPSA